MAGAGTGFLLGAAPGLLAGAAIGSLLAVTAQVTYLFAFRNFHAVVPGQAYRCAQPSGPKLAQLVRAYHIRTVVNLRGAGDRPWYREERQAVQKCGVAHVDIPFNSARLPFVPDLVTLVNVFDNSPRPLLLHCCMGVDRTGLASAMFLLLQTDSGLAEARRQLGLRYGHFSWAKFRSGDEFLDQYAAWLENHHLSHSAATLRGWLERAYCPGIYRYRLESLAVPSWVWQGKSSVVRIRLHNTSIGRWHFRSDKNRGIHVGYFLQDRQGRFMMEGRSGLHDAQIDPGESIDVILDLPALKEGEYRLEVDMVDENRCWFSPSGCRPLLVNLQVRSPDSAAR